MALIEIGEPLTCSCSTSANGLAPSLSGMAPEKSLTCFVPQFLHLKNGSGRVATPLLRGANFRVRAQVPWKEPWGDCVP